MAVSLNELLRIQAEGQPPASTSMRLTYVPDLPETPKAAMRPSYVPGGDVPPAVFDQGTDRKSSLRAQLQVDDPTTPAAGMTDLARGWYDWRRGQHETLAGALLGTPPRAMRFDAYGRETPAVPSWEDTAAEMPFGPGNVAGMARRVHPHVARLQKEIGTASEIAAKGATRLEDTQRVRALFDAGREVEARALMREVERKHRFKFTDPAIARLRTPRIPVAEEALDVKPTTAFTPGQPTPREIMGDERFWRQLEATEFPLVKPANIAESERLRRNMPPIELMDPSWKRGAFQGPWYAGAYPEAQRGLRELSKEFPKAPINLERDPELLVWLNAASSPANEPYKNFEQALTGAYARFLQSGRRPGRVDLDFESGELWMPAHSYNSYRAMYNAVREGFIPLSGRKIGNFGLGGLGYEQAKTADRWSGADAFGIPTTKVSMSGTQYTTAADRIREWGERWATTPLRAQGGSWSGSKLDRDKIMARLTRQGLTDEQVVPALREVFRYGFNDFLAEVRKNPKLIKALGVGGVAAMLERARQLGLDVGGAEGPPPQ